MNPPDCSKCMHQGLHLKLYTRLPSFEPPHDCCLAAPRLFHQLQHLLRLFRCHRQQQAAAGLRVNHEVLLPLRHGWVKHQVLTVALQVARDSTWEGALLRTSRGMLQQRDLQQGMPYTASVSVSTAMPCHRQQLLPAVLVQ